MALSKNNEQFIFEFMIHSGINIKIVVLRMIDKILLKQNVSNIFAKYKINKSKIEKTLRTFTLAR